jgi:hypothetical protein
VLLDGLPKEEVDKVLAEIEAGNTDSVSITTFIRELLGIPEDVFSFDRPTPEDRRSDPLGALKFPDVSNFGSGINLFGREFDLVRSGDLTIDGKARKRGAPIGGEPIRSERSISQDLAVPEERRRRFKGKKAQRGRNAVLPLDELKVDSSIQDKPESRNPDGSISTERTITTKVRGKWFNIPTIIFGVQVSEEEAVSLFEQGEHTAVGGPFNTVKQAEKAARERTEKLSKRLRSR